MFKFVRRTFYAAKMAAGLLSLAILFGLLPMGVFAQTLPQAPPAVQLVAFAPLSPQVAVQNVAYGTGLSALTLPTSLAASAKAENAGENGAQSGAESGAEGAQTPTLAEILPQVTWAASPEYDGNTAGEYIFSATVLGGFILAENASPPSIAVHVAEAEQEPEAELEPEPEEEPEPELQSPAQEAMAAFSLAGFAGQGTQANPLQITSAQQMLELANLVNAGTLESAVFGSGSTQPVYIEQMNDIELINYAQNHNTGKGWVPVGSFAMPFKGHYNGGGHTVSGLYINQPSSENTGLFGVLANGASVKNIALSGANIRGGTNTGGIAGLVLQGQVENCALVGRSKITAQSGGQNLGGIVGNIGAGASVKNCHALDLLLGMQDDYSPGANSVGGIAGTVGGLVENCYTTGTVDGSTNVGGIAGDVLSTGTVQKSAALCQTVRAQQSGAFCGRVAGASAGTLAHNLAFSAMAPGSGSFYAGLQSKTQLNGENVNQGQIAAFGTVNDLFVGDLNPWQCQANRLPGFGKTHAIPLYLLAGGLHPFANGDGSAANPFQIFTAEDLEVMAHLVNNNSNYRDKSYILMEDISIAAYGQNWNGGRGWTPIGHSDDFPFKGNFDGNYRAISDVYIKTAAGGAYHNTGLFGYILGGEVKNLGVLNANINCVNYSTATGDASSAGVLAGFSKNAIIENCHSTGILNGQERIGGLLGGLGSSDYGGTVKGCFSLVNVSGKGYVGGLVGYTNNQNTLVQNSYAKGAVQGTSPVGGLIGRSLGGQIKNCYSLGAVLGTGSVGGIAGNISKKTTIAGCAALNPSISANSADVGRIVGSVFMDSLPANSPVLLGNRAFLGMQDIGMGKFGAIANNVADKNGANITKSEIKTANFWAVAANWNGTAYAAATWLVTYDRLPALNMGGNQQNSIIPPHLALKSMALAAVSLSGVYTYTGSEIVPTFTVKIGQETLVNGRDYTFTIADNINAGTANILLQGKGDVEGGKSHSFTIGKKTLVIKPQDKSIKIGQPLPLLNITYTGLAAKDYADSSMFISPGAAAHTAGQNPAQGSYAIVFATQPTLFGTRGANYNPVYQNGTLAVNSASAYEITALAGLNGTISPGGLGSVMPGASRTYTITPNAGYKILNVVVNCINKGAISAYTFTNVQTNNIIVATFVKIGAVPFAAPTAAPVGQSAVFAAPPQQPTAAAKAQGQSQSQSPPLLGQQALGQSTLQKTATQTQAPQSILNKALNSQSALPLQDATKNAFAAAQSQGGQESVFYANGAQPLANSAQNTAKAPLAAPIGLAVFAVFCGFLFCARTRGKSGIF